LRSGAGRTDLAADNARFFLYIAVANGVVDLLRYWRGSHG
jgi:hypothetical protein